MTLSLHYRIWKTSLKKEEKKQTNVSDGTLKYNNKITNESTHFIV